MAKAASKPSPQRKSSLQAPIFAVLMYFLYGLPRNFKFKQKYQQYDLYFQIIFLFLMTMLKDNHKKQGEVALSRSQECSKINMQLKRGCLELPHLLNLCNKLKRNELHTPK